MTTNTENGNSPSPPPAADEPPEQPPASVPPMGPDMSSLIDTLTQSDAPETARRGLESEMNRDHVLTNLKEDEIWERKWDLMNNEEMILSMFPPPESVLQGEVREQFGLDGGDAALTPEKTHDINDTRAAAFARTARGRNGWQQRLWAENKSISEVRRVDADEEDDGLLSRFFGGW